MDENVFSLQDRLDVIRKTIEKYGGEDNFFISFSGGKDSTVLHHLIDEALPGNSIPRVYFNTGIEYTDMLNHVRDLAKEDNRFVIYNSGVNIRKMLEEFGYPFKSKEFARNAFTFDNSGMTRTVYFYVNGLQHDGKPSRFKCPSKLKYIFTDQRKERLKISHKCCNKLKKDVSKRYIKETGRKVSIIGVRQAEGGARKFHGGCVQFERGNLKAFKPLNPLSNEFMDWYIKERNIKLCKLYYPPFNFNRTGCKGCPFAVDIQKELDLMAKYLPAERKQCEYIWRPVYEEYRSINYRLKPDKDEWLKQNSNKIADDIRGLKP